MNYRYGIFSMLILVAIILVACSPQAGNTPIPSPEITPPDTEEIQESSSNSLDKFVTFLNDSGVSIEMGGVIEAPYFSSQGKVVRANNEDIQVFQYSDPKSRQADSDTISSDGTIKGQVKISWISQPIFWAHEDLLVIYLGSNSKLIDLISLSLGEPISQPDSAPSVDDPTLAYPDAVLAAIQDLSERLDISPDQITVIGYESKVWPDSCLGVGKAGEMCLQVISPGFIITLSVGENRFVYHSDEIGQRLLLVGEVIPEGLKPGLDLDKQLAVLNTMQDLSQKYNIPVDQITIVSVESAEWPNSCLGIANINEVCAQMITPGWSIILNAQGNHYEYHTDLTGENIRQK
jgi:hypothetical protein